MKPGRIVALLTHPAPLGMAATTAASLVRSPALTKRLLISLSLSVGVSKVLKRAHPRQSRVC
jgi:hypothetical protein